VSMAMVGESSSTTPTAQLCAYCAGVLFSAESAGMTGGWSIGSVAVARGFIGTGTGGTAGQPPSLPARLGVPFGLGEEPLLDITLILP
jgi:hypothetical protein